MRALRFALVIGLLVAGRAHAGKDDTHIINDHGATLAISCTPDRAEVVVNGSDNTIAVSGSCAKLVVNGSKNTVGAATVDKVAVNGDENTVDLETAGKIALNGDANRVTYKKGAGGKKAPSVSNLGKKNVVAKKD